jgi:hypothetical protein
MRKVRSLAGVSSFAVDEFSNEFDDEEIQNEFDQELLDELEGYDETHGT